MLCLDEGFESAMTVMALPAGLRRFCRTSNHIERLNRELKRRSSVIGIFPNEESLVRTMGAVLIEESHQRQSGRALFSPKTFKEFMTPEVIKTLIEIANEQQRVMAAQAAITRCPRKAILHTNPDLTIMPDHVHLLLEVDPQFGIHKAVKTIKGKTSRILRQEFHWLTTKLPTLWTNSYFCSTVGGAPLEIVKQYIESQKTSQRK